MGIRDLFSVMLTTLETGCKIIFLSIIIFI